MFELEFLADPVQLRLAGSLRLSKFFGYFTRQAAFGIQLRYLQFFTLNAENGLRLADHMFMFADVPKRAFHLFEVEYILFNIWMKEVRFSEVAPYKPVYHLEFEERLVQP